MSQAIQNNTVFPEREAAAFLAVSPRTLQGWRSKGGGPAFIKMGRSVRYRASDLDDFLNGGIRTSTSDVG